MENKPIFRHLSTDIRAFTRNGGIMSWLKQRYDGIFGEMAFDFLPELVLDFPVGFHLSVICFIPSIKKFFSFVEICLVYQVKTLLKIFEKVT
jgi:hypothetical protein